MVLGLTLRLLDPPTVRADLLSVQLSCVSALSAFLPHFPEPIARQLIARVSVTTRCETDSSS